MKEHFYLGRAIQAYNKEKKPWGAGATDASSAGQLHNSTAVRAKATDQICCAVGVWAASEAGWKEAQNVIKAVLRAVYSRSVHISFTG